MQPTLIHSDAYAFITERAQAQHDEAQEHVESRDEQKAEMVAARLKSKLETLTHDDLVAGLHSVTQQAHGAALRAAWLDGEEALGALLMQIVRDQLSAEADLEAEEALIRIEGAAREEAATHRTFIIAGY